MFESSANNLKLKKSVEFGRSLMYNKNKVGPRTEPWGTPHFIHFSSDIYDITCDRFDR